MTFARAVAVLLVTLGANFVTPASAATVFVFGGQNDTQNSIELTRNGLTLEVSAFELTAAGVTSPRNIDRDPNGWGVGGDPDGGRVGFDSGNVLTEFFELSFSVPVSFNSISLFHEGGNNGAARFGSKLTGIERFSIDGFARSETFIPASAVSDTWFLRGQGRGVRLNSINVDIVTTDAAIPLPATLWMLLAGVSGLGLLRHFRQPV